MKHCLILLCICLLGSAVLAQPESEIRLQHLEEQQRVEVYVEGEFFTAYRYDTGLEKPLLFPLHAPGGIVLTRGYPLEPRARERVDHPHHVGLWFNFGDVNGMDFWNNSQAVPEERKERYGRIVHQEIRRISSGSEGLLEVAMDWMAPDNSRAQKLLSEETTYIFRYLDGHFVVDRFTRLTASAEKVQLTDNKEGMLAIRVDRAFEHPSESPVLLTDASGQPEREKVVDNEGVSGWYRNSEGDEGMAAWGKNARWVKLSGKKEGRECSMVLMDHPGNLNHPPCWHARGYGLFSVNNLGRQAYNKRLERFQMELNSGESISFRHRFVSAASPLKDSEIEALYQDFIKE